MRFLKLGAILALALLGAPLTVPHAAAAGAVVNTRKLICSVAGVKCKTSNTPIPPGIPAFTPELKTGLRISPFECVGDQCPTPTGGAFRLECTMSHQSFDDPIVYPGVPNATHQHTFFGNATTNAYSTLESLMAATSTSCRGGTANKSAYWFASIVDIVANESLAPIHINLYYKHGWTLDPAATLVAPPNGLRMIGGRRATAIGPEDETFFQLSRFSCDGTGATTSTIPTDCAGGHELWVNLAFPQCWNGVDLDSPDHRSHMTTAIGSPGNVCPTSHPVPIPEIEFIIRIPIPAWSHSSRLRVSCDTAPLSTAAGWCSHADAFIAWTEEVKDTWMEHCIYDQMDCHENLLGDGTQLY